MRNSRFIPHLKDTLPNMMRLHARPEKIHCRKSGRINGTTSVLVAVRKRFDTVSIILRFDSVADCYRIYISLLRFVDMTTSATRS